jgi:hypothetical protein
MFSLPEHALVPPVERIGAAADRVAIPVRRHPF